MRFRVCTFILETASSAWHIRVDFVGWPSHTNCVDPKYLARNRTPSINTDGSSNRSESATDTYHLVFFPFLSRFNVPKVIKRWEEHSGSWTEDMDTAVSNIRVFDPCVFESSVNIRIFMLSARSALNYKVEYFIISRSYLGESKLCVSHFYYIHTYSFILFNMHFYYIIHREIIYRA